MRKPDKTVDIGQDGVSLSLDTYGRILQASTFHPEHGIIVANPFEQFDGTKFYDPTYVRNYRKRMLHWIQESRPGLGISFRSDVSKAAINIPKANAATFDFALEEDVKVSIQVHVVKGGDILQWVTIKNNKATATTLDCDVNLCVSLNRASYGQLTEGGPIPLPKSRNIFSLTNQGSVNVINPELGAQLYGEVGRTMELDRTLIDFEWPSSDQEVRNAPLDLNIPYHLGLKPHSSITLKNRFRFRANAESYQLISHNVDGKEKESEERANLNNLTWLKQSALTTYILRRNVDYILANCTVPVVSASRETSVCIMTDHVALPLGWNRDNYWQLRLLYESYKHSSLLLRDDGLRWDYISKIHDIAKGHLEWVFRVAQRPHGYWHRSYIVTGKPKDGPVFQLDQQCYPLLELCDYLDYFPADMVFVRKILELGVVNKILDLLQSKRDIETGLWPTDETPGDDAVLYPYHFSSHVLLWRTLTSLRDLYDRLYSPSQVSSSAVNELATSLRTSTLRNFTVTHPELGMDMFAYLTDGQGNHTFYHDANDIPTLFAQPWSFVTTPSEIRTWHNTMAFGLSPANKQGYCNIPPYPGLGSVHSPGAWVLGYFQELAYAAMRKDEGDMRRAWGKTKNAMQWDGTFSEAVDPMTGKCSSKAWFSWPGSMIGALIVQLRSEDLERVLLED
ncbi:uncharacterized protein N0V89_003883 [Didymosphaeria variabile]|uniref:Uncharacterized protein n=1 Tax=Didymosphaeria variabile TaxID=1932322 RepID=A0A9W8XPJ1_9PLEO|nr:uncharacterized protein N0V89_003883 [Didymosphaeria variabile]KAJ4355862.1 hypothetical protein N0V89_003883 [Didymosphaeria variabile]